MEECTEHVIETPLATAPPSKGSSLRGCKQAADRRPFVLSAISIFVGDEIHSHALPLKNLPFGGHIIIGGKSKTRIHIGMPTETFADLKADKRGSLTRRGETSAGS